MVVVGGGRAHRRHHLLGGGHHMAKVARVAREALGMAGVVGGLPPPEVGRVGDVAERSGDDGQRLCGGPKQICRAARARGVLERVAGPSLCGVHAYAQHIGRHAAAHQADARLYRLGAGLAGELPVGSQRAGGRANRLGHNGARWLHRIRVAFAAHPDGGNPARVDMGAGKRVARRLHAHGGGVLIQPRHGFFAHGALGVALRPHAADLAPGQAIAGHIGAVAHNPHGVGRWLQHGYFPSPSGSSEAAALSAATKVRAYSRRISPSCTRRAAIRSTWAPCAPAASAIWRACRLMWPR